MSSASRRHEPDCPDCGKGVMYTTDSRQGSEANVMRRRRKKCRLCGFVCTTHEVIVDHPEFGKASTTVAAVRLLRDFEVSLREHFGDEVGSLRYGRGKST